MPAPRLDPKRRVLRFNISMPFDDLVLLDENVDALRKFMVSKGMPKEKATRLINRSSYIREFFTLCANDLMVRDAFFASFDDKKALEEQSEA